MIKLTSTLLLIVTLAFIVAPSVAQAQPTAMLRCTTDQLDATAILQRLEWARKCALTTNTAGPASWINSDMAFDSAFNAAKDYVELNTNRAYSASSNSFNVNYSYAFARYQSSSLYNVFQEASGPTAGFFKWSGNAQRPRPFYPIFETSPFAGGGQQLFPLPTLPNECNLYTKTGTTFTRWTGNFYVVAYCVG